jgi:signal transduction histidine kinase
LTVVSEREEAKKRIRVSILDTGCGIPEEELDHIMEPFFTTKKEGEGTGLGLSIVYGVVKSHGGHVEVESRQGAGSQFTLYFPVG